MLVWQDIFTNDEVVSDANKPEPVKDSEGKEIPGLFMVQSRNVAVGSDAVDIGCGDAFGSGDQEVDDSVETVNNISDASIGFAYTEITFASKTELKSYLKSYFRKLLNHPTLKEGDEDTVNQMHKKLSSSYWRNITTSNITCFDHVTPKPVFPFLTIRMEPPHPFLCTSNGDLRRSSFSCKYTKYTLFPFIIINTESDLHTFVFGHFLLHTAMKSIKLCNHTI